MTGRLLILGASARAAAMSARRGGFESWAADRFCDLDLQACCPAIQIENYPADFAEALTAAPAGTWLYTGALENHPELIDRLAKIRPLYGIGGAALRAVRDPLRLAAVLQRAGISMPECSLSGDGLPQDGSWLIKPFASAGGIGIEPWTTVAAARAGKATNQRPCYFQRGIDGLPVAAVYVAAAGRATLLGVTRQLLGEAWCGLTAQQGHAYRYCGSVGPLELTSALASPFQRLGNVLAAELSLVGLFGVDAIIRQPNQDAAEVWPIEVNPRYTASVEVLEHGCGADAIRLHVAAWGGVLPENERSAIGGNSLSNKQTRDAAVQPNGKAILFARSDLTVKAALIDWIDDYNRGRQWPLVADIPAAGTTIRRGHPIVSLFAVGRDEPLVIATLKALAAEVEARLG
jgi:predicted ATP-grasp superfamily ATP-dependent carboligase